MPDNRVRIRAELEDEVSKGFRKIEDAGDHLAKSTGFQSILQGVGLSAGQKAWEIAGNAIENVGDVLADSIEKASNMNETISKSQVVFPRTAAELERFGDSAARNFGIAKQQAIEAASGFGQFFQGAGAAEGAAEDMSEKIVGLASDLASFNNLDPTDVLAKLKSGLAGEAEPLRSLGVFLNEANVKAEAMKLGLADAHSELTEGAKVLARYQLILDQTSLAQGDFRRTADGEANSQRALQATIDDTEAKIGQKLLPIKHAVTEAELGLVDALARGIDSIDAENAALERLSAQGLKPTKDQVRALAREMMVLNLEHEKMVGSTLRGWLSEGATGGSGARKRAGGGPVWPGSWDVGENGPERLTIFPGGGGFVTPMGGGGGGGGGGGHPAVVQINLDGQVLARVVDEHLYWSMRSSAPTGLR